MTDDKNFKRLVRDEARQSGRRYTEVRSVMRPGSAPPTVEPMAPDEVARRYDDIVTSITQGVYGKDELVRLVALALVVPGNVLLRGGPGNGMTVLGLSVADAIGGRGISIDGRTGLAGAPPATWQAGDVIVLSHFDGLEPADQVAVLEASRRPALVLAKRHPIAERMPYPPDDDTRERFLFGAELDYGDFETELRIVNEVRDGRIERTATGAVDRVALDAMRQAAARVTVPDDVRRFAVEAIAATRTDPAVLLGASTVATLGLVQAAAAAAVTSGRDTATVDDVNAVLPAILHHRVVYRAST